MKIVKILLIELITLSLFIPVHADQMPYQVMDNNSGFSQSFATHEEASKFIRDNIEDYNNLVLYEDGEVVQMEYGVVEFVGNNGVVEYYSKSKNCKDYIYANYGIDAAYLYTDEDKVYFKVSGDVGYTSINNVILHPYDLLNVNITCYQTINGYLYHNIKTQLEYENYGISIKLDYKPSFLADNSIYYSYDGHYFYDDFYSMIDDYVNNSYENALNEYAYYNYYQYLPYRSLTNYTVDEVNNYLSETLGINGRLIHYVDANGDNAADEVNRSQLFNNVNEFFGCESLYGTNAMMLLSSAIVESNYGKSLSSYLSNNLYLNAAYDTDYERENQRYNSIAESIHSYAKYYVSKLYSNQLKSDYYGTIFGDKLSGVNVENSIDHYYGEKCASEYFKMDESLGLKDRDAYGVGIINDLNSLTLYNDVGLGEKIATLSNASNLGFVILCDYEESYKIQIDYCFNPEYLFDIYNCVAYIPKNSFKAVINEESIHSYNLGEVNYDFNGGNYHDFMSLTTNSLYDIPSIIPYREGYEFVDYSKASYDDGSEVYVANWKKINSVEINRFLNTQGDLLPYPDLTRANIVVHYEDNTFRLVSINSDMISKYDVYSDEPQTVTINYNGVTTSKDIQIDTDYFSIYETIGEAIENGDYSFVRDNMANVNYPLSMNQIRIIDYALKQANKRNYVIKDSSNKYNISISGLDLSLDDRKNFSLIEDTYYVNVEPINVINREEILAVATGYGFTPVTGLNISFKFNYQKIDLRGPAIVQIDLDGKDINHIYSVYHLNKNGDIVKCKTTQSENFIQFIIEESGDYEVLSMPSVNTFMIDDNVEDLSYANMGFDNNRINIEFMFGLSLIVIALIGIIIYYRVEDLKDKEWKDYKKSLLKADTVQEEKQNN